MAPTGQKSGNDEASTRKIGRRSALTKITAATAGIAGVGTLSDVASANTALVDAGGSGGGSGGDRTYSQTGQKTIHNVTAPNGDSEEKPDGRTASTPAENDPENPEGDRTNTLCSALEIVRSDPPSSGANEWLHIIRLAGNGSVTIEDTDELSETGTLSQSMHIRPVDEEVSVFDAENDNEIGMDPAPVDRQTCQYLNAATAALMLTASGTTAGSLMSAATLAGNIVLLFIDEDDGEEGGFSIEDPNFSSDFNQGSHHANAIIKTPPDTETTVEMHSGFGDVANDWKITFEGEVTNVDEV